MNKEEMFKNLSDKDKKEVLSLMSFMKKFKEQERKKELYATYEEYLDLIHISEHLSNENELLQSQLDIANKKLDEIEGYVKLRNDELNDFKKSTINDLFNVNIEKFIKDILSIIGGE
jgi:flagellar biosynthesis/type III secretory pathway ATPase